MAESTSMVSMTSGEGDLQMSAGTWSTGRLATEWSEEVALDLVRAFDFISFFTAPCLENNANDSQTTSIKMQNCWSHLHGIHEIKAFYESNNAKKVRNFMAGKLLPRKRSDFTDCFLQEFFLKSVLDILRLLICVQRRLILMCHSKEAMHTSFF